VSGEERVYRVYWRGTYSTEFLGRYFARDGADACERARREHGIEEGDGVVLWTLTMDDQRWAGREHG